MSRQFSGGTNVLYTGLPVLTAYPYTLGCWFYFPNGSSHTDGLDHGLFGLFGGTINDQGCYLDVDNRGSNFFRLQLTATDASNWTTTRSENLYGESVWNAAVGKFTSNVLRACNLNNTSIINSTDTTNRNPSLIETVIGAYRDHNGNLSSNDGHLIAHCAIWNIILANSDIDLFMAGRNPLTIQPANLKGYWPLIGNQSPEPDYSVDNHPMTVLGATFSTNNPPVDALPVTTKIGGSSLLLVI